MESITYSDNWNGKLLCNFFPDIRLPFPGKYTPGNILQSNHDRIGLLGLQKVISVYPILFKNINDHMAYTVCGNNAGYLKKMLSQFYENINQDTQLLHIVFMFTMREADTLPKLLEKHYDKLLSITPRSEEYIDGPHQQ